jgi:hypothetical protein
MRGFLSLPSSATEAWFNIITVLDFELYREDTPRIQVTVWITEVGAGYLVKEEASPLI